jgi:hypothetical protein
MQNNLPKENPFLTLLRQNVWNIEDFILLLKQAASRNKELVFFDAFADLLSECSTLTAVFRLQDPRPIILSFIAQSKIFNKSDSAFYYQMFEPVLDAMISSSPNCVHRISSASFIKRMVIKAVKSRFDLEPPFIRFVTQLRSDIKVRAPAQKSPDNINNPYHNR